MSHGHSRFFLIVGRLLLISGQQIPLSIICWNWLLLGLTVFSILVVGVWLLLSFIGQSRIYAKNIEIAANKASNIASHLWKELIFSFINTSTVNAKAHIAAANPSIKITMLDKHVNSGIARILPNAKVISAENKPNTWTLCGNWSLTLFSKSSTCCTLASNSFCRSFGCP